MWSWRFGTHAGDAFARLRNCQGRYAVPIAKSPFHQRCACALGQRTDSSSLTYRLWGHGKSPRQLAEIRPIAEGGQLLPDLSRLHGQEPKADKRRCFSMARLAAKARCNYYPL